MSIFSYICTLSVKSLTDTQFVLRDAENERQFRRRNSICNNMQKAAMEDTISCRWSLAVSTDTVQVNITNPHNETQNYTPFSCKLTKQSIGPKGFVVVVYFDTESVTNEVGYHTSLVKISRLPLLHAMFSLSSVKVPTWMERGHLLYEMVRVRLN